MRRWTCALPRDRSAVAAERVLSYLTAKMVDSDKTEELLAETYIRDIDGASRRAGVGRALAILECYDELFYLRAVGYIGEGVQRDGHFLPGSSYTAFQKIADIDRCDVTIIVCRVIGIPVFRGTGIFKLYLKKFFSV